MDKTGGQAFPMQETNQYAGTDGMTLRDYFAGQAMASTKGAFKYQCESGKEVLAKECYAMADAMIKEREK